MRYRVSKANSGEAVDGGQTVIADPIQKTELSWVRDGRSAYNDAEIFLKIQKEQNKRNWYSTPGTICAAMWDYLRRDDIGEPDGKDFNKKYRFFDSIQMAVALLCGDAARKQIGEIVADTFKVHTAWRSVLKDAYVVEPHLWCKVVKQIEDAASEFFTVIAREMSPDGTEHIAVRVNKERPKNERSGEHLNCDNRVARVRANTGDKKYTNRKGAGADGLRRARSENRNIVECAR